VLRNPERVAQKVGVPVAETGRGYLGGRIKI
jgi:hypothetical protein